MNKFTPPTNADSAIRTVAVYGTLREGYGNNVLLRGCRCLGQATIKGLQLYSMSPVGSDEYGNIPFAAESSDPDNVIHVEIWSIPHYDRDNWSEENQANNTWHDALASCDALEGHPTWYTRVRAKYTLEGGERAQRTWVYMFMPDVLEEYVTNNRANPIPSGDWTNPLSIDEDATLDSIAA